MSKPIMLVADRDQTLCEMLTDSLTLEGYSVRCVADSVAALEILDQDPVSMLLSDTQMLPMDGLQLLQRVKARHPDLPVLLMSACAGVEKAVQAMQGGAVDYLVKPVQPGQILDRVARFIKIPSPADPQVVIAEDLRTRELLELARRVARSDATVLIGGKSGTGKEVFARYIHQNSTRCDGPLVAINCAAIPADMLEAVLFGYEKGAFTGAHQSVPGKFEQAQDGTLLLDEISEMNLGLQAKLLRVLQEREVDRLGGRKSIQLNVRVLATSNRKLREEVAAGRFREDLFYRLNVFPLTLPALRDRARDILPLANYSLAKHMVSGSRPPRLSPAAEMRLLEHSWPGNVRELDNLIQRALILQDGTVIEARDLSFEAEEYQADEAQLSVSQSCRLSNDLKTMEEQMILDALQQAQGNRKSVAERLGISQRTLRYKIAKLRDAGIAIPR